MCAFLSALDLFSLTSSATLLVIVRSFRFVASNFERTIFIYQIDYALLARQICLGYLELVRVVDHSVLLEDNITLLKDVNSRPYGRRYRRCIPVDSIVLLFLTQIAKW